MKDKVLHINPNKIKRNEIHFEIQRNNRTVIYEDKTKYVRSKFKNNLRKEVKEYGC